MSEQGTDNGLPFTETEEYHLKAVGGYAGKFLLETLSSAGLMYFVVKGTGLPSAVNAFAGVASLAMSAKDGFHGLQHAWTFNSLYEPRRQEYNEELERRQAEAQALPDDSGGETPPID